MQALVADTIALPAACAEQLLGLSRHVVSSSSSSHLTARQHLVLAELHLDAALQLQSGKKPSTSTASSSSSCRKRLLPGPGGAAPAQAADAAAGVVDATVL